MENKSKDNIGNYSNESLLRDLSLYHKLHIDCTEFTYHTRKEYDYNYGHEYDFTVYEYRYPKQFQKLIDFMLDTKDIYMYCPVCERKAYFRGLPLNLSDNLKKSLLDSYTDEQIDEDYGSPEKVRMSEKIEELISKYPTFDKIIRCTHSSGHEFKFSYLLQREGNYLNESLTFTKIGQYPSVRDLSFESIKPYQKLLKKYKKEYVTALELRSAGIGIGCFVYFRRIIEFLLEEAFLKAKSEGKITENEYRKKDDGGNRTVREKIKLIKDYLPEFMVKNAVIYNILSKGIHELEEEECKEMLPILQKSIELILDEQIAIQQKEKAMAEASRALSEINSQNNNKKEVY